MEFSIGLGEVLTFVLALVGAGWALISLTFRQFEKRQDEKFKLLDLVVSEIKRLEVELIRNDTRNAQTYTTKQENEKVLDRIFAILEKIDSCLTVKISREEVSQLVRDLHRPS